MIRYNPDLFNSAIPDKYIRNYAYDYGKRVSPWHVLPGVYLLRLLNIGSDGSMPSRADRYALEIEVDVTGIELLKSKKPFAATFFNNFAQLEMVPTSSFSNNNPVSETMFMDYYGDMHDIDSTRGLPVIGRWVEPQGYLVATQQSPKQPVVTSTGLWIPPVAPRF